MIAFRIFIATAFVLLITATVGLVLPDAGYAKKPVSEGQDEDFSPGQGDIHRADPCKKAPDPLGLAFGIDKRCVVHKGTSAGVSKGDFNGDGFADLAIGVPDEDIGSVTDGGAVIVIYGSTNGLIPLGAVGVPASQFWSQNTSGVLDATEAGDHFGASLAAGNFNNDAFSDLAIGVPDEDGSLANSGAVNILYGSAAGLTATGDQFIPNPFTLSSSDRFGVSLVWGFFNSDSFGDLAVGIPNRDLKLALDPPLGTGAVAVNAGAVAAYYGSAGGVNTASLQFLHQSTPLPFDAPDSYGDTAEANDQFGKVLGAGDFNGDNLSDLAVGIPQEELPSTNLRDGGAVHIIYAAGTGLSHNTPMIFNQDSAGVIDTAEVDDRFGSALAAGDFNGDTRVDLAIGVPDEDVNGFADAGGVNVLYGSAAGLSGTGSQFWNQANGSIPSDGGLGTDEGFGTALAAGLMSGDAFRDLAIGVPGEGILCSVNSTVPECANAIGLNTIFAAGAVNVIYGSVNGLSTSAGPGAQLWSQDTSGISGASEQLNQFGSALSSWDFGKGGQADLAVGVAFEDVVNASNVNVAGAGAVNIIYGAGSGSGLTATGNQIFDQNSSGVPDSVESGDHFGASIY